MGDPAALPDRPPEAHATAWARPAILVLTIVVGSLLVAHYGHFSPEAVAGDLQGIGTWGPLLLLAAYVLAGLFFFPITVLGIAAGFVFGPLWGVVYVFVAVNVGAVITFLVGRLSRGPLTPWLERRAAPAMTLLRSYGAVTVMGGRMLPFLPFAVLNYAMAFSTVRMRDYLIGTLGGVVPLTVVYVMIGATVGSVSPGNAFTLRTIGLFTVTVLLGASVTWTGLFFISRGARRQG